jgi:hypothetical protein
MNHPLHIYLNDLVGNAKQLTITTDNARIPMELSVDYGCREDVSYYSGYSSGSHSSHNTMDSSTGSQSSVGSSSRWDSETSTNSSSKERLTPKKPLRRLNSSSPPASPRGQARLLTRSRMPSEDNPTDHRRQRIVECLTEDLDDDMCLKSSSSQQSQDMSLKAAASGMLRMPQRRASNEDWRNKAGQLPSRRNKRSTLRESLNMSSTSARRNVGDILGEAMRELGMEEELAAQ